MALLQCLNLSIALRLHASELCMHHYQHPLKPRLVLQLLKHSIDICSCTTQLAGGQLFRNMNGENRQEACHPQGC